MIAGDLQSSLNGAVDAAAYAAVTAGPRRPLHGSGPLSVLTGVRDRPVAFACEQPTVDEGLRAAKREIVAKPRRAVQELRTTGQTPPP